ncbi:MAG: alpha/beta fold hydrolase [Planctomycetota bacterium]|nr:alpha/beta fold hydrolase [Planctomycetota bacterium]
MPLPKLKKYMGRNPCPKDMDSFWDASLAEMRRTDARVELRPAAFKAPGAECFDLHFTGVRGARVYAKYLRPKGATTRSARSRHGADGGLPAVLLFHGYSGSSGDWFDKLAWVSLGFCVAALDCRGQGGRSQDAGAVRGNTHHGHIIRGLDEDSPTRMLFRDIFLDTAQLAGIVMAFPEVDPKRVGATGGSQGGGLTLACASLEPRIKRAAPVFPFLCDYKRVWELDLAKDAYQELKTYFRLFDPCHEREDEIFTKLGYIDCQHLAKRIRGDILMAVGLMDTICPPSSQFAAYNKIRAKKQMVLYPDFSHEGLPRMSDRIFEFMLGL